MPEKKKEKKKSSQCCNELSDKIDVIYEILSVHKIGLEEIEGKVEEMSLNVDRLKGRMGL